MPFDAFEIDPLLPASARLEAPRDPYAKARATGANIERLLALSAFLKRLPARKFDMANWGSGEEPFISSALDVLLQHPCGSSACVAGWACRIFPNEDPLGREHWPMLNAERILGLKWRDAEALFLGNTGPRILGGPGPKDAARVIDRFLETGKMRWPEESAR